VARLEANAATHGATVANATAAGHGATATAAAGRANADATSTSFIMTISDREGDVNVTRKAMKEFEIKYIYPTCIVRERAGEVARWIYPLYYLLRASYMVCMRSVEYVKKQFGIS